MSNLDGSRIRWDDVLGLVTPTPDQRRGRIERLLTSCICTEQLNLREVRAYLEIMVLNGALVETEGLLEIAGKPGAFNVCDEDAGVALRRCAGQFVDPRREWRFMGHVTRGSGASGGGSHSSGYSYVATPPSIDAQRQANRSARVLAERELEAETWAASNLLKSLPELHQEPVRVLYGAVFRLLQGRIETLDQAHSALMGVSSKGDIRRISEDEGDDSSGLPPSVKAVEGLYLAAFQSGRQTAKEQYTWLKLRPELCDRLPRKLSTYSRYVRLIKTAREGKRVFRAGGASRSAEPIGRQRSSSARYDEPGEMSD